MIASRIAGLRIAAAGEGALVGAILAVARERISMQEVLSIVAEMKSK